MAVDSGAQKWLREPASEKARVVRCRPAPMALRTLLVAVAVEQRGGGVVHEHHHRRRAAHPGQPADHVDGVAQAAAAPEGLGDGEAEDAGLSQGVDAPPREGAVGVDRAGLRADDLVDDPRQRVVVVGIFILLEVIRSGGERPVQG